MDRVTPSAGRQALEALVPGVIAGVVVALSVRGGLGPLAGYDAAALFYVGRVWHHVWPLDADQTAAVAAREDPTRSAADVILLVAAVTSLGAVAAAITWGHTVHGSAQDVAIGLGTGSVVVSWLLVHTVFALKYARLYYRHADIDGVRAGEGGVKFDDDVRPPYSDFGYLAFTIGMTFQVSDTDFQTSEFRRLALRHALLSYLFGAVILGASINLVAGLAT
jgi:uncharacterized membrane protein